MPAEGVQGAANSRGRRAAVWYLNWRAGENFSRTKQARSRRSAGAAEFSRIINYPANSLADRK